MRRIGVVLAVATLVATGAPRPAGTAHAAGAHRPAEKSAAAQVNKFLTRLARQHLFTGTVLVSQKGAIVLRKGYGYSNWEKYVPNTHGTRFLLADLTMQFTAMAVLQLQEEGKLHIQDRVAAYIPSWPTAWKDVTVHQLLSHTSGIPNLYGDGIFGFDDTQYWSPEQIIGLASDQPLFFKPGTNFHYSSLGYIALGLVIEKASGDPYAKFLQEHIFGPLGMAASGVDQHGVPAAHLARGYDDYVRVTDYEPTNLFSAGDVYSTVDDLSRWDAALLTGRLASTQSLQAMFTPSFTFQDTSGYGYGWGMGTMNHHRVIDAAGGMPGFSALNALFPEDGVSIIILTNNDRTALDVIFPYIAKKVLGKAPVKRVP